MLYDTTVMLKYANTIKTSYETAKGTRKIKLHNTIGNEVQTQFIDMILRNNEILPQIY